MQIQPTHIRNTEEACLISGSRLKTHTHTHTNEAIQSQFAERIKKKKKTGAKPEERGWQHFRFFCFHIWTAIILDFVTKCEMSGRDGRGFKVVETRGGPHERRTREAKI